jgi:hypothetical protein
MARFSRPHILVSFLIGCSHFLAAGTLPSANDNAFVGMAPLTASGEYHMLHKILCFQKQCAQNTRKMKSVLKLHDSPLTTHKRQSTVMPKATQSKYPDESELHLCLRGGCAEPGPWNENQPEKIEKELEEIRKFAATNSLPIPSDDPHAVDLETMKQLFPGGGNQGLDDPRLRYLAQLLPAIQKRTGAETDDVLWPGDRVVVSPENPHGPPYNATVADLPLILALLEPSDADARRYQYMRFQRRFETADPQPSVLTEEEFLQRFYPDLDRHPMPSPPSSLPSAAAPAGASSGLRCARDACPALPRALSVCAAPLPGTTR